ncbi:6-phosphogluconolactonase [uncultured Jatrophihabitans sp.]|uniref:6-phosphogluconolactonase n=1 Tax=uncultured Jatrophihabitans sp. TaxID=1610747 RepID=UPI0035CAF82F
MSSEPEVVLHDDADQLAERTAERAVSALGLALDERSEAHLVVTGGSILEAVLAGLVTATERAPIDWSRVHVWWGDERYVPSGDDDRNDRPARAKAFDHLRVSADHLHPMPASDAGFGDDLDAAAASYAGELAAAVAKSDADDSDSDTAADTDVPAFDVVLLGLGPDGHCASLFPGHPGTRVSDASVIGVRESPKPPPNRLSLTFPALDAAREIWVVASGDGKADAVARALGGAPREEVPAAGARGTERTLWLIDRAAASRLRDRTG